MAATDPTEAGANDSATHSVSLDEVPMMTTRQHLDYLVGLIITAWKKTMVKRHNASDGVVQSDIFNELSFHNYDEDSVTTFRTDMIPESIPRKVEALRQMQRIGLPNLADLIELGKEELAESPFAMGSDESSDGNEPTFTGLLTELAKCRLCQEYNPKEETGFNLTVVFVDGSGKMQLKMCRLQQDTDFPSFLVLMDDYPQEYNLNIDWAASFWDEKIRELKEKGYDGHHKLAEVEQLIATHKATNYDDAPKWVFFKTNQQLSYAKSIENEDDFKKILDIVTNPDKNNRLACMVRAVDKQLIFISDELKFFEQALRDSASSTDEAALQDTQSNPSDQQPHDERLPRIGSFTTDDCSFDILARTVGVPLSWAFMRDEDDEEGDRPFPWSLMEPGGQH